MRIPKHIGIIPDGNRRWAVSHGLTKDKGYNAGIDPGFLLFKQCEKIGIKELTFYGFTVDNTKRPSIQKEAFTEACINAVNSLKGEDVEILVLGNTESSCFPKELLPYTKPIKFGTGKTRVNFLINYGWEWDLNSLKTSDKNRKNITNNIRSNDISRIDLIIRWGGRRRLSGFLPVQSVYSDFYIIDRYWPDFSTSDLEDALNWYNTQDVTLGG